MNSIEIEDRYSIPFFNKLPLSIERGEGVYVFDEAGDRYLDFTAGWGVTCLGHAHPVITEAITRQSQKIIQNPSSGLSYSPARARLLALLAEILPGKLSRVFLSNSGAEANDAAIKLARKVSGRTEVISTNRSFHGRTISTASATGQAKHREKFSPLMPSYHFIPYNDIQALEEAMTEDTAAVILEPIQGEGGVNLASEDYLKRASSLCETNGSCLIIDEVQTGFCRTGSMFAIDHLDIKADFMTMAKGMGGGFPIGGFAVTDEIASKIEKGDHGGTFSGNPLGSAVAFAVISYLKEHRVADQVKKSGERVLERLNGWSKDYAASIQSVRGRGLLLAIEFFNAGAAAKVYKSCLEQKLLVNLTQDKIIRLFPSLLITQEEMEQGLDILEGVLASKLN